MLTLTKKPVVLAIVIAAIAVWVAFALFNNPAVFSQEPVEQEEVLDLLDEGTSLNPQLLDFFEGGNTYLGCASQSFRQISERCAQSMSDNDYTIAGNENIIFSLATSTDGILHLVFSNNVHDILKNRGILYIDGQSFHINEASDMLPGVGGFNSFRWNDSGLDWSINDKVSVRLTIPKPTIVQTSLLDDNASLRVEYLGLNRHNEQIFGCDDALPHRRTQDKCRVILSDADYVINGQSNKIKSIYTPRKNSLILAFSDAAVDAMSNMGSLHLDDQVFHLKDAYSVRNINSSRPGDNTFVWFNVNLNWTGYETVKVKLTVDQYVWPTLPTSDDSN